MCIIYDMAACPQPVPQPVEPQKLQYESKLKNFVFSLLSSGSHLAKTEVPYYFMFSASNQHNVLKPQVFVSN